MSEFHRLRGLLRQASVGPIALAAVACGSESDGAGDASLSILLESEDVVVNGLQPGTEPENIRDGWAVQFDKYLATVGDIDIHRSTDESIRAEADEALVVDLVQVPGAGLALWQLDGLSAGRWELYYATPGAADGATRHQTVDLADYDRMREDDWTYWVHGTLTHPEGQSCPPATLAQPGEQVPTGQLSGSNPCYAAASIEFEIGASAETNFGPCEIDDLPGFSLTSGINQTVSATLHGDHLFFNGFPEGGEGGVSRLAQWLADCDLNLDGTVTVAELQSIPLSALVQIDDRYQLGGSPVLPLETVYDYVRSQLKTQGHFQGEGECDIDGAEHDH